MSIPTRPSDWARLFRMACSLIRQVNSEQSIIDSWSLGGGTAMMLQIDHRESHDVDIFLPDPQFLSYLDPKLHDFKFEIFPADHDGDGSSFLKIGCFAADRDRLRRAATCHQAGTLGSGTTFAPEVLGLFTRYSPAITNRAAAPNTGVRVSCMMK
jgi:hypothetical protein